MILSDSDKSKMDKLFESDSNNYDTRKTLNLSNTIIDKSILDTIDKGISIEYLSSINVPILKYKTQITIHGQFPKIDNSYAFGYKSIIRNLNNSIGVKYIAIDADKKEYIGKVLRNFGWYYRKSSICTKYELVKTSSDVNEIKECINSYKNILSNLDKSSFFGSANILYGSIYGIYMIVLEIQLDAIYKDNIPKFLDSLGYTSDLILYKEKELNQIKEEKEIKYKEEKEAETKKLNELLELNKEDINYFKSLPKVSITSEFDSNVFYGRIYSNVDTPKGYVITVYHFDKPKNKRKFRYASINIYDINDLKNISLDMFKYYKTYESKVFVARKLN